MFRIGLILFVVFMWIAIYPVWVPAYNGLYAILLNAAHGQDPILMKVLAAGPFILLVGIFVMPLLNWWQKRPPTKL